MALTTRRIDSFYRAISTLCVTILLFASLAGDKLLGQAGGSRTISIYNIHTKQTLTITYKKRGKYIPAAMKKINHVMGDWRRKESRIMRPDLIDLMWEVHNQLGSRKPIHLISGYRSRKTNNKLRRRGGGQAKRSRHILGMAADVHFPDIPVRELRDSTLIRQKGGVGYYPTSGLPFVHMDVGRVRHWPRISRSQLAALFPSGRSKHVPRDGRPINKRDAKKYGAAKKVAKMRRIQLARRRVRDGKSNIAIASLDPNIPTITKRNPLPKYARKDLDSKLAALEAKAKRTLAKPSKKIGPPLRREPTIARFEPGNIKIEEERALVQLAAIDTSTPIKWQSFTPREKPKTIKTDNVAYSPEVDEEHPDELNYRAFSLSPLASDKPISEDKKFADLSPPDYVQTSAILAGQRTIESAQFRPGLQFANLRLANTFIGTATSGLPPQK